MISKLTFYDFLGYIVPGSILLLILVYWAESVVEFDLITVGSISGTGETVLFLVVAYLAGHLIQVAGRRFELSEKGKWGGYFSVQFLRPDSSYYSAEFRERLLGRVHETFDIAPLQDEGDEKARDGRLQEIFNLCYTLVVQRGISQHADIHNAIFGMFRGVIVLWLFAIALFTIAVLRHSAVTVASVLDYNETPIDEVKWHLVVTGLAAFAAVATLGSLRDRFRHFGQRFVDAVYRSFYVDVTTRRPAGRP